MSAAAAFSSRYLRRFVPGIATEIVLGKVIDALDLAGQESATQRRVGNEPDTEFAHRVENVIGFRRSLEQRIFGLQRRDRVRRVGTPDRLRRGFGQTEITDLAFRDEFGHRADSLLDRTVWVDAVQVIEVDVVGFEVLQRPFERLAGIFGAAVDRAALAVVISCSLRVQKLIIGRDLTGVNAMS